MNVHPQSFPGPLSPQDEAAVRALIHAQQAAWNRGDSEAWAAAFEADASFINMRGEYFMGRAAIARLQARIFAGPFYESTAAITIHEVRQLAPGCVLLEVEYLVTQYDGLPAGVQPTEPGILRSRMTLIAHQQTTQWQLTFAQNTAVASKASTSPALAR